MKLNKYYEKLATRYGDRPAIVFRDETVTYADIGDASARLANVFRSIGLRSEHHVGILMTNRPEYLITDIATARAGIVSVPLNNQLEQDDIRAILEGGDVRTLIVGPRFLETARELQQELFDLNYIIGITEEDTDLPTGFHDFDDLLTREPPEPPSVDPDKDDVASLFFTGGTTGPQKGVMHTHESLILNAYAHIHELEIRRHERVLLCTPLAHSANFIARAALAQGATLFLQEGFESRQVLRVIEAEEVSWTFLVPTMIARLLDEPALADADVSSLETVVYGASSMPPTLLTEGIEKLGNVFIQLYGLMEVPDVVTTLPKSKHDPEQPELLNTVGYPTQLVEVKIVDEDDRWPDDTGELAVNAPFAMKGYYKHEPSETEWVRTGDLGRIDEKGRVVILDRIQDTIQTAGHLVHSTHVENVLQRHSAVKQVAVIGIPAERGHVVRAGPIDRHYVDQEVKAVVACADGADVTVDELREFCRGELAEHELPTSVDFVGHLPETPYGKVDKNLLREPYW